MTAAGTTSEATSPAGISDRLEGLGARLLLALFGALPVDGASALGGFLGRLIGPRLGISKRARINLHRALPNLSDTECRRIIHRMWDNLGRVIAEYPHLASFKTEGPDRRIELVGSEHVLTQVSPSPRFIFVSAHFGNWEVGTFAAAKVGLKLAEIYRSANNPFVDRLIQSTRAKLGSELIPKGPAAGRRIAAALREGRHLCMLVDQKMNDGIPVPFFGRDAMTTPGPARLALRHNCRLVPVRAERLEGARFRIICYPPLTSDPSGNNAADTARLTTALNQVLEGWIRAQPEQWFGWLHRRWPD